MIDISQIPSNSKIEKGKIGQPNSVQTNKAQKQQPIKPLITSDKLVGGGKKSLSKKFLKAFLPGDVQDIKKYMINEVLIPQVKMFLLDGLGMMFFGETYRKNSYNKPYGTTTRTMYESIFGKKTTASSIVNGSSSQNRYVNEDNDRVDYTSIIVQDRKLAEDIVEVLRSQIIDYDQVSIGDLYSAVGLSPKHTDFNWGWTRCEDINVRVTGSGFLIDVEPAKKLI